MLRTIYYYSYCNEDKNIENKKKYTISDNIIIYIHILHIGNVILIISTYLFFFFYWNFLQYIM